MRRGNVDDSLDLWKVNQNGNKKGDIVGHCTLVDKMVIVFVFSTRYDSSGTAQGYTVPVFQIRAPASNPFYIAQLQKDMSPFFIIPSPFGQSLRNKVNWI